LSAFQEQLTAYVNGMTHWRQNVIGATRRFLDEGLRDRAITRDIDWGVPVPLPGYESKRIYVWFEAVIGYLSATKEWAKLQGDDSLWERFWKQDTKIYNFIGKDNIFFHTLSWPATLMGYGGLNLPYDVPSNEFLNIQGQKLSTSRNWAVWVADYLELYDPDPLRYYLSAAMPETQDSDFSWDKFVHRNNDLGKRGRNRSLNSPNKVSRRIRTWAVSRPLRSNQNNGHRQVLKRKTQRRGGVA
jgi:methionyl-tRNA synthetase